MYADGFLKDGRAGTGACRMGPTGGSVVWKKGWGLGGEMEIMDAEMVGILKTMTKGHSKCRRKRKKTLTLRIDSQQAMRRCQERNDKGSEMLAEKIGTYGGRQKKAEYTSGWSG